MFPTGHEIIHIEHTVAFSGHRKVSPAGQLPLFGSPAATQQEYESAVRCELKRALDKLVKEGYRTFLCGMATGFDLMAGKAVCDLIEGGEDISLVAAIPYPGQADRFSATDKATYERIIRYSSYVNTLCDSYRKECFHIRNDYLVENSSVLVCFYNGTSGGTQYTVKKALRSQKRVINLY